SIARLPQQRHATCLVNWHASPVEAGQSKIQTSVGLAGIARSPKQLGRVCIVSLDAPTVRICRREVVAASRRIAAFTRTPKQLGGAHIVDGNSTSGAIHDTQVCARAGTEPVASVALQFERACLVMHHACAVDEKGS